MTNLSQISDGVFRVYSVVCLGVFFRDQTHNFLLIPILKPHLVVSDGLFCVCVLTETNIWKRYWHLKHSSLQETAV